MKLSAFCLLSLLLIWSCSKPAPPPPEPVARLSFWVYGKRIQWDGSGNGTPVCTLCGPQLSKHSTHFTLSSSAAQNSSEALILMLKTAAITTHTYNDTLRTTGTSSTAVHRLTTSTLQAAATEIGDYASVTITAIREGKYYDGTFRARLTSAPFGRTANKVEIEQGTFYNVQLK